MLEKYYHPYSIHQYNNLKYFLMMLSIYWQYNSLQLSQYNFPNLNSKIHLIFQIIDLNWWNTIMMIFSFIPISQHFTQMYLDIFLVNSNPIFHLLFLNFFLREMRFLWVVRKSLFLMIRIFPLFFCSTAQLLLLSHFHKECNRIEKH